jgi:hypothetical protein
MTLVAGCFSGTFLESKICSQDADCGPELECVGGYCGGVVPASSTGSTAGLSTGSSSGTSSGTSESESESETVSSTGMVTPPCEELDLLVIIDQSMSMEVYEDKVIAASLELFTVLQESLSKIPSYHIGFTFASEVMHNEVECQGVGSLLRRSPLEDCSELYMGGRPYVTEQDEFGPAMLCLASAGSLNVIEEQNARPAETILNVSSPEANMKGGCNEGFFRPEAAFAIALVTDVDDDLDGSVLMYGSLGEPYDWYSKIWERNEFVAERVGIGVISAPALEDPECDAGAAPRLHEFLDLFNLENTVRVNICDDEQQIADQFGAGLEALLTNTCGT